MKQRGFTVVELLIVIVVIAILASISVVAYRGIQQRTRTSSLKQDVSEMYKAQLIYATETQNPPVAYSDSGAANNILAFTSNDDIHIIVQLEGQTGFCIYGHATRL